VFTISPLTSDMLAISLDGLSSPTVSLNLPKNVTGNHSLGWGFGWYPGGHDAAMVAKDPAARGTQVLVDTITDWSNFRSTVFFCKISGAGAGYTHTEAQPFSRSFAGRDWLFMHNGDLDKMELEKLHGATRRLLEPMGTTDSELAFIYLLARIREGDARQYSDIAPENILSWFQNFDALGSSDMYTTDGQSVICFHGSQSPKSMYYARIQPPENQDTYESAAAQITLNDPRDTYRTALVFSSTPFSTGTWTEMLPGQMIIARRGAIVWNSVPSHNVLAQNFSSLALQPQAQTQAQIVPFPAPKQAKEPQKHAIVTNVRAKTSAPDGKTLSYRLFEVMHATHYEYSEPVEHSSHTFRLQPVDDPVQEVVHSRLTISTPAEEIQYEDVFGNQAIHCLIDQHYSKLSVEAKSRVKVFAEPPDDHSFSRRQTSIPLAWMPWQRQMMTPYLLPSELPEDQLRELTDYAMSFVERNGYHLLRTVEDINLSIYRDYRYVPGSTSLKTTPFEVYASREGVCQDFANLFICLTRLLSIPARYRMGYIYTGANYTNKIQSDASHAWAEVYLPYVGWRGFDPTNGCAVAQDHIRVACGRNFRDATPTSGTIYRGGGTETLSIEVTVREIRK
jgi:transglutaminase-like putative cysteine protease/predicted glutamine amidotransferase